MWNAYVFLSISTISAQRVPEPDPTWFSFENHQVAGNLIFQVLPDISGKHEVSGITRTRYFGYCGDINFRRLRFLTGTVTQTFAKHASVQSIFAQYVQNLYTSAQTLGDQNATRRGLLSQKPEAWRTMFKKTAELEKRYIPN